MKASRILLFIFASLLAIVLLGAFFPEEGIEAGPLKLRFPSVERLLAGQETTAQESLEEDLENQLQAIRESRISSFEQYASTNPARFYFPSDDYTLMDPLFEAMDSALSIPVKFVHYGDSQLEADFITRTFRAGIQRRFGGGGPGSLPVRKGYYTHSFSVYCDQELERHLAFGPQSMRGTSPSQYGPLAQSVRLDTSAYVSFTAIKKNQEPSRYFNRMSLMVANTEGGVSVRCGKSSRRLVTSGPGDIAWATFELPDSSYKSGFSISGHCDILGVNVFSDSGISVDNVAMRGSSGTIFTRIKGSQLKEYYDSTNTRLIILQYGGNVVPYMKTDKRISDYGGYLRRQIDFIRQQAPDALILFIGPSDMATTVNGEKCTWPHLTQVIDTVKAAALSSGAVYWDMCQAMGGTGSMVQWVNSSPALAAPDYTHFTKTGSDLMGEMLYGTMMVYYDYYKWRKDSQL